MYEDSDTGSTNAVASDQMYFRRQLLSTATTCTRANSFGDNDNDSLSVSDGDEALEKYIGYMEGRNAALSQHILTVQQQAHTTIESQKAKISELSAALTALTDIRAKFPSWYSDVSSPGGAKSIGSHSTNDDENNASHEQKRRVEERENEEVLAALSHVTSSFLATLHLPANKRRFSRRRLARILVDSVLAFEWLRCKVAGRTSIKEKLNRAIEGTEQSSLAESLTSLLNRRFQRCTNKQNATVLVDVLWDESFLTGEAQSCMVERVWKYVRSSLFTTAKILKQMYLACRFQLEPCGDRSLEGYQLSKQVQPRISAEQVEYIASGKEA